VTAQKPNRLYLDVRNLPEGTATACIRQRPCQLPQQFHRINIDQRSNPLQRLQREVALAALQTTHVCAVDANEVSEGFLTETACLPISPKIPANGALQITFHVTD
jgi:hypothetical protein